MADSAEIFAQRLKEARELRELSQGGLAEKSGLQASAISHFETGARKPSFDNLRKLSRALEVTTDFLLGKADSPGAHGETLAKIARHIENMSSKEIEYAEQFLQMMAKNKKNSDGK